MKSARIVQLDFFRGIMLLVMMLNHLRYFPLWSINEQTPWLPHITFQPLGFFTGAEGFVFLSGLVFAIVYTPRMQKEGMRAFDMYVLRRFLHIYKWHIGTYALIIGLFLIPVFNAHWPYNWDSQEMLKTAPLEMLMRAMVLMHHTGLLDILPLYLCFIVFIPLVMRALASGRSGWVLTGVAIVWGIAVVYRPQLALQQATDLQLPWFEVLAWQAIFFIGIVLGYHIRANKFRPPITREWVTAAAILCAALFAYRHSLPAQFGAPPDAIAALINDRGLGPIRIINMAAVTYLLYALCMRKPTWCRSTIFTSLGQRSIQIFSWHILVCYLAMPWRPWFTEAGLGIQLFWMVALTVSLYLPVLLLRRRG